MDSLEEKYMKLLAEYEKLANSPKNECEETLQRYQNAYQRLNSVRQELVKSIEKLYSSWFPPKIASLFSTLKAWAKTGFKKSEFKDRRLAICNQCEYFKDNNLCSLCGCYMKAKADIAAAQCPISKWKSEIE